MTLTSDQLLNARNTIQAPDPGILAEVRYFAEVKDPGTFASLQELLWRSGSALAVGRDEPLSISGPAMDSEVVASLWKIRGQTDGALLQSTWDRLLRLLTSRYGTVPPEVRLTRIFCLLAPGGLCPAALGEPGRRLALQLGIEPGRAIETAALVREKLRAILGKEDLEEAVCRMQLCGELARAVPVQAPLVLWASELQRRDLPPVGAGAAGWKKLAKAVEGGVEKLDAFLAELAPKIHSPVSRKALLGGLKSLGLVAQEEGRWFPGELGKKLLAEHSYDALIERVLVQVRGAAGILRLLPLSRSELVAMVQPGAGVLGWLVELGLVEEQGDQLLLTEVGQSWEKRLPAQLAAKLPAAVPKLLHESEQGGMLPDGPEFLALFAAEPSCKGLLYPSGTLESLAIGLGGRRFVLVSGPPGTGKTALLLGASLVACRRLRLDIEKHRLIVPVSPEWRDPSALLGWPDALQPGVYRKTPVLKLLLQAASEPGLPFFLILDELNLARPELYLAPLLSSMETQAPLLLHGEELLGEVPGSLAWPENLFIAGTLNNDETTWSLSDRVLDRAFVVELAEIELEVFFANQLFRQPQVENLLLSIQKVLEPVGRALGYRIAGEVLELCRDASSALVDAVVLGRILARLRGEGDAFLEALAELERLFNGCNLPRSARKVGEMRKRVRQRGVGYFWAG